MYYFHDKDYEFKPLFMDSSIHDANLEILRKKHVCSFETTISSTLMI